MGRAPIGKPLPRLKISGVFPAGAAAIGVSGLGSGDGHLPRWRKGKMARSPVPRGTQTSFPEHGGRNALPGRGHSGEEVYPGIKRANPAVQLRKQEVSSEHRRAGAEGCPGTER